MAAPSRAQWHAVLAGFLGWTLDAFDFFVVVFMVDVLAQQFHVSKGAIVTTLTATLATRPLGALIFGLLADRFGRRVPLMANVIFFSVIELLCGFSPNFTVFFILRTLYGIGMGGEWGVGASLAMEMAPPRWRGVLSGMLQSGYPIGYLIAAVAARFVLPNFAPDVGWRAMFWVGGLPALLALYIRMKVPESEAWKQHRAPNVTAVLKTVAGSRYVVLLASFIPMALWATSLVAPRLLPLPWSLILVVIIFVLLFIASRSFAYLALLLTFMMFLSHGTQDLYPDFLKSVHGMSTSGAAYMAMMYNVGAVVGAIIFGELSERIGRRRSMMAALVLSLLVIPLWAFGHSLAALVVGSFLMQAGVQGAWGVIPAHLNELAPDAARGLLPGLSYQLGILFAAPSNNIQYALRNQLGYQWAIGGFELANISLLIVTLLFGHERKGRSFVREPGAFSVVREE